MSSAQQSRLLSKTNIAGVSTFEKLKGCAQSGGAMSLSNQRVSPKWFVVLMVLAFSTFAVADKQKPAQHSSRPPASHPAPKPPAPAPHPSAPPSNQSHGANNAQHGNTQGGNNTSHGNNTN